jgi:hypothetical protein
LLPSRGVGLPGWLFDATIAAGCVAGVTLLATIWIRVPLRALGLPLAIGVASALVVPVAASGSVVAKRLGSFDTPFEPVSYALGTQALFGPGIRQAAQATLPELERLKKQFPSPALMATQTAVLGAPTIFVSGQEVYPLGGYDGTGAAPSLKKLESLVAAGEFHLVVISRSSKDPRYVWIRHHCRALGLHLTGDFGNYFCGTP